ncbi:MAG: restriction endonuclease [Chloroflexota bacterium]
MAVPPFTEFWLPLLRRVSDGQVWVPAHLTEVLADEFGLSEADRAETIPSGRTRVLDRVLWTITYLRQAGVVESPQRGRVRITERGRQLLTAHPDHLGRDQLLQFQEFRDFVSRKKQPSANGANAHPAPALSASSSVELTQPDEVMDEAYQTIMTVLADDVLAALKGLLPARFEQVVVDVLVAMGYGGTREDAANVVGKTGDGGIDGVIKEDRLGLDTIYVQAKRWDGTVGRGEVASFVGSLLSFQSGKGVFITTGTYSADARKYVDQMRSDKRVVLIDGLTLARLMIEHGVGVAVAQRYEIKRMDSDYFSDA